MIFVSTPFPFLVGWDCQGLLNDGYCKNVNLPGYLGVIGGHAHLVWLENLLCFEFEWWGKNSLRSWERGRIYIISKLKLRPKRIRLLSRKKFAFFASVWKLTRILLAWKCNLILMCLLYWLPCWDIDLEANLGHQFNLLKQNFRQSYNTFWPLLIFFRNANCSGILSRPMKYNRIKQWRERA